MTAEIQTRIQLLLQGATGFTPDSVTVGDFRVIDSGNPPYGVVVPGPFKMEKGSFKGLVNIEWTNFVDIIARFQDDSYEAINTAREAAINRLLPYLLLNDLTLTNMKLLSFLVSAGDDLKFIYARGSGPPNPPQFVMQRLTTVTETSTTYSGEGDYG